MRRGDFFRSKVRSIAVGILALFVICPALLQGEQSRSDVEVNPGDPKTQAASLHVDPTIGDDANDGRSRPVQSIARAIKLAQPGDTIHLEPGTYFESADFTNKHGLPGKPITLEGHGAVLDGSEPVTESEWERAGPDLFRRQQLYRKTDNAIVARWFLLWDGEMQRMGRCSKGPSEPLKAPDDLEAGEWTYVEEEDAFYLKLSPGQELAKANIRYPKRSSAVIQSQAGSWLTVKNLTGTHVYNDGFNVHGAQRNLVFENIRAIECGDDGFSAHEDADCRIDGFVSIGNATGLCDTGTSQTHYRNVFIRDCHGFDLYFIGLEHSLENAVVESSAARTFWLDGNRLENGEQCRLRMKNVTIRRKGDAAQELRIGRGGSLHAMGCSFEGLNVTVTPGGAVNFRRCLFREGRFPPEAMIYANTIWRGAGNRYEFSSLRVGHTVFERDDFEAFQKLTASETDSVWQKIDRLPEGVGADETSLPSPIPTALP